MVGSSILPVTIHKNKLYFLFGKETPLETSAPGWSDFGGGVEPGENVLETALREGGEELTGFLGDAQHLKQHVQTHGGIYPIMYMSSTSPMMRTCPNITIKITDFCGTAWTTNYYKAPNCLKK